ncbi:UNVERIFIED_CONTAM: chitin deacetylase [Siphonaria sp. JEL0065]|nr:chitin deacetylase [Siphonaria sp. JEL0065]
MRPSSVLILAAVGTTITATPIAVPQLVGNSSVEKRGFDFSWRIDSGGTPAVPVWTSYFKSLHSDAFGGDIKTCNTRTATWGASFDDGPSDSTHVVLEYFKSINQQTTFWVIGDNVVKHPDVLISTYKAGHDIGIHTYSHRNLPTLSDDEIISELVYGAKAIVDVLGVYPRFFRPPYGAVDDRVRKLAKSMGLTVVTWSTDSADWSYLGKGQMYKVPQAFKDWMDKGYNNGISLEHDYYPETVSVVKESLDIVLKSGKTFKPLKECIGVSDVYGNKVLEAFFTSGRFENRNSNPPPPPPPPPPTSSNVINSVVTAIQSAGSTLISKNQTSFDQVIPTAKGSSSLSTAALIGIIAGALTVLAVVVGVWIFLRLKKKKEQERFSIASVASTASTEPFLPMEKDASKSYGTYK